MHCEGDSSLINKSAYIQKIFLFFCLLWRDECTGVLARDFSQGYWEQANGNLRVQFRLWVALKGINLTFESVRSDRISFWAEELECARRKGKRGSSCVSRRVKRSYSMRVAIRLLDLIEFDSTLVVTFFILRSCGAWAFTLGFSHALAYPFFFLACQGIHQGGWIYIIYII